MRPLLIAATFALAAPGCTDLAPYATAPLAAAAGVTDAGPRVAVCYDWLLSKPDEVQRVAQRECAEKTIAMPADTDWRLDNCPLALPVRATFVCTPDK